MLFEKYGISADLCRLDEKIMAKCADAFRRCEDVRDEMQLKVLKAFAEKPILLEPWDPMGSLAK